MSDTPNVPNVARPQAPDAPSRTAAPDPEKFKKLLKVEESDNPQKRDPRKMLKQEEEGEAPVETAAPQAGVFEKLMSKAKSSSIYDVTEPINLPKLEKEPADEFVLEPLKPTLMPAGKKIATENDQPLYFAKAAPPTPSLPSPTIRKDASQEALPSQEPDMLQPLEIESSTPLTQEHELLPLPLETPIPPEADIEEPQLIPVKVEKEVDPIAAKIPLGMAAPAEEVLPNEEKAPVEVSEKPLPQVERPLQEPEAPPSAAVARPFEAMEKILDRLKKFDKPEKKEPAELAPQVAAPIAAPVVAPQPMQAEPVAPVQAAQPLFFSRLAPEVFDILQKMCGMISFYKDSGISTTTVTVNMPGSVFNEGNLVIEHYDTAPKVFNIQFEGSDQAVDLFNENLPDLVAAIQHTPLTFEVNVRKAVLSNRYRVETKEDLTKETKK
jgi:hypothetical protein